MTHKNKSLICMLNYKSVLLKCISACMLTMMLFNLVSCENKESVMIENEKIVIKSEDGVLGEIILEDIKALKSYKRRVTINSSSGAQTGDFRGALLYDIFNNVDEHIVENFSSAEVLGADGYFSNISMEEIKKENKIYIMYEDAGKPLKSLKGSADSMRLIILGDDFGQRYTNYVVEIMLGK